MSEIVRALRQQIAEEEAAVQAYHATANAEIQHRNARIYALREFLDRAIEIVEGPAIETVLVDGGEEATE